MSLKRRLEKLRAATGIGRCECKAEPSRWEILYVNPDDRPPDEWPDRESCQVCGLPTVGVIAIEYVDMPPPGWFVASLGEIDEETAQREWREYIESHARGDAIPTKRPAPALAESVPVAYDQADPIWAG